MRHWSGQEQYWLRFGERTDKRLMSDIYIARTKAYGTIHLLDSIA